MSYFTTKTTVRVGQIAIFTWTLIVLADFAAAAEPQSIEFHVRESAGIRRRYDVVSTTFDIATKPKNEIGFRLLRAGKPVPSQFRRQKNGMQVALDFVDHFDPFESRKYSVEFGDGISSQEPEPGLRLKATDTAFHINSAGVVDWTVRRDLKGLLDFSWKELDYIADNSLGMYFKTQDGQIRQLSDRRPSSGKVLREGPIACALEFTYNDWPVGCRSHVIMELVRTKSWIRMEWRVSGNSKGVTNLGAELNLALDGHEKMLDFGAGDFVYSTVRSGHRAILKAGPEEDGHTPWRVMNGPDKKPELIAVASRDFKTPRVFGWAHIMDDRRCTALAIDKFAERSTDRIEFTGDGKMRINRSVANSQSTNSRSLQFWLHFVGMPVHIGARTSPRSMQEPLTVEWRRE